MNEFWYRIRRGAMYTASLLPFKVLYAISDLIYFIAYHIIRYRRRVVAKNLRNSFPEKGADELRAIEKRFYHSFCDSVVEMFKLLSISREELMRRMSFSGTEEIEKSLETHPQSFIYLGHFCNWEWISSMPLWFSPGRHCAQLYHPMHSPERVSVRKTYARPKPCAACLPCARKTRKSLWDSFPTRHRAG